MKRGTIILTPFPFTDLSENKVRPALKIYIGVVDSIGQFKDIVNLKEKFMKKTIFLFLILTLLSNITAAQLNSFSDPIKLTNGNNDRNPVFII